MHANQRKTLDRLFSPVSLALIGFSTGVEGIDSTFFLKNLRNAGFAGRIYLIDPFVRELNGIRTYPNIAALPEAVDLAIMRTLSAAGPAVLFECAQKGISNIQIIKSDFEKHQSSEIILWEKEIMRESRKRGLNLIGPDCLGPYTPASRLMFWGQIPAISGRFAFISQDDYLTERMTHHAYFSGFGISKAVSIGKGIVLDTTDFLEYLAEDSKTGAIGIYMDCVREPKRILEIARALYHKKPLFIWKGGDKALNRRYLAPDENVSWGEGIWENGIRQSRSIRVHSLEEMASAAMAFLNLPLPRGRRVFILGGGGGNSVHYADLCIRFGLQIPQLTGDTLRKISALIPAVGSFARNPVDAWKSFHETKIMEKILDVAFSDDNLDMIILERLIPRPTFGSPTNIDTTQATIEYIQKNCLSKPVVVVVDGSGEDPILAEKAATIRGQFCHANIPAYSSIRNAASALAHFAKYWNYFPDI